MLKKINNIEEEIQYIYIYIYKIQHGLTKIVKKKEREKQKEKMENSLKLFEWNDLKQFQHLL